MARTWLPSLWLPGRMVEEVQRRAEAMDVSLAAYVEMILDTHLRRNPALNIVGDELVDTRTITTLDTTVTVNDPDLRRRMQDSVKKIHQYLIDEQNAHHGLTGD